MSSSDDPRDSRIRRMLKKTLLILLGLDFLCLLFRSINLHFKTFDDDLLAWALSAYLISSVAFLVWKSVVVIRQIGPPTPLGARYDSSAT